MTEHHQAGRPRHRAGARVGTLLLLLILAALAAPYEALVLARLGASAPAEKLFAFTVRVLDRVHGALAPDWAYLELAALRPQLERQVELARLAREKHPHVSAALYERAIPAETSDQRLDWLEEYAGVLGSTDPFEAARADFAAAGIAASTTDRERTVRDFEASLARVDDPNVRWQEARFLLNAEDSRAADVLREILKRNATDTTASYTLGLLEWAQGHIDEAQTALEQAAKEPAYAGALRSFQSGREADQRWQQLQQEQDAQLAGIREEHAQATAQHNALYERLRRFQCDPRQIQNWENVPDQQIEQTCRDIEGAKFRNRLALAAAIPLAWELLVARLGLAAEMGAAAEAGAAAAGAAEAGAADAALSAEGAAAIRAAATMEERFAVVSTDALRMTGSESVERSIALRKRYYWKVVGSRLTAKLEAEQNYFTQDIEAIFLLRETKIVQYFAPQEADAMAIKNAADTGRRRLIATVYETKPVFKVKLGRIRLDGSSSDCDPDRSRSTDRDCSQPKAS